MFNLITNANYLKMSKFIGFFSFKKLLECRQISTRITSEGKEVPRRKHLENRITLIGADNSVSITDLKIAQNLSIKRELKLVKIQDVDAKTRRPVYRLMTNSEYHTEELESRKEKQVARQNSLTKGQKLVTLSSRIGEQDLKTNVKKITKLLEKQYEVKVTITGDGEQSSDKLDRICAVIEKDVKSIGKLVQKTKKGNNLRFQLLPVRENSSQATQENDVNQNTNDKGPL